MDRLFDQAGRALRRCRLRNMDGHARTTRVVFGIALAALCAHFGAALLDPGGRAATWIFYAIASLVAAALIARAGSRDGEDGIWIPAAIAGGAWFVGSAYYGEAGVTLVRLASFSFEDLTLVLFFAPAA